MGLYDILNTPVSRRTALKVGAGIGLGAAVSMSGCGYFSQKTELTEEEEQEIIRRGYNIKPVNKDYKLIEKRDGEIQALVRTSDIGVVVLLRGKTAEAKKYYYEDHPEIRALSEMSAELLRAYGDNQPYINSRLANGLADLNDVDERGLEPGMGYRVACIIYDKDGLDRLDKFLDGDHTFKSIGLIN